MSDGVDGRTVETLEARVAQLERQLAGSERGRTRRGLRRPSAFLCQLAASSLMLALLVTPLAIAGEEDSEGDAVASGNERGEPVEIGLRNRSDRETGLIASGDGYSLRLSNVNRGEGGGAIFGCRAAASAEESCVNADNLLDGQAFFFRSREGSSAGRFQVDGPNAVPFTTNARGLVQNLNAEMVGGLTAQQLIAQASGSAPADPVPGAQGPQGPQGPAGPAGPAGSDAEFDGAAAGGDLTGTYPDPQIAGNAVESPEIATNAVGASEIATDAVGAAEIGASQVGQNEIADNSVTANEIATNAVQGSEIAPNAVDSGKIQNGTVIPADLAPGLLNADDLDFVAGQLTILANSIETASIENGAVTNAKLGSSAVDSSRVANGSLRRVDDSIFDTFTFIDPPSIAAGDCETDVLTGGTFSNVAVGDVGYTYPLASVADGLMVQTGIRQSVAGQFQYKICNVSGSTVNDSSRVYGVRLVR